MPTAAAHQLHQDLAERFLFVDEELRELLAPLDIARFNAFTYSARTVRRCFSKAAYVSVSASLKMR